MNERLFNLGLKRFKDRGEKERAIRGKRDLRADRWVGVFHLQWGECVFYPLTRCDGVAYQ